MPTSSTQNRTTAHRTSPHSSSSSSSSRSSSSTQSRASGAAREANRQVSQLFEQAMNSYEQAFRSGLKLQEESRRWFAAMLETAGPSRDWHKTFRSMTSEMLPEMQKRMEEGLRMVEQNSRTSLEVLRLFQQATDLPNANPMAETQNRLLSFWEASLDSMRGSARSVAEANTQAIESWMELFRKGTQFAAEQVRTA